MKLTTFGASLLPYQESAELIGVLWMTLTWLALIALWGTSERWHLATGSRRRLARLIHALRHDDGAEPFDWARRAERRW